ncbi:unnamed protein product [Calicophoron daubneyi]|uniref:Rab-GAP TBC domain-containing protein n=1 Tax=Calicophoron daubneyi TaxID=300641 RepID=A0AAV2TME3_CALDB
MTSRRSIADQGARYALGYENNPILRRISATTSNPPSSASDLQGEDIKRFSFFSKLLHKMAKAAAYDGYYSHVLSPKKLQNSVAQPTSTSFLILNDRPQGLPVKNRAEHERHSKESMQLQMNARIKQQKAHKSWLKAKRAVSRREKKQQKSLNIWRQVILPKWDTAHSRQTRLVREQVWHGIPCAVRAQVWPLLAGISTDIDRSIFDQCLRQSRNCLRTWNECQKRSQTDQISPGCTHSGLGEDSSQTANHNDNTHDYEEYGTNCPMCSLIVSNLNSTPMRREFSVGVPNGCPDDSSLSRLRMSNVFGDGTSNSGGVSSVPYSSTASSDPSVFNITDRTASLRAIKLDVSRTFPSLGLFQPGNPLHDPLHDLLAAYVVYQPQIGYVQGMSFIAAILLLVMNDTFDAFVLFAHILDMPCHRAFYSLEENEFIVYFRTFDRILAECLPQLYAHFKCVGMESNMYLFDWLFTIFSRSLNLDAGIRIWDLFFLEGELALLKAALAILRLYESQLLESRFDKLALFLTSSLPDDLTGDQLIKEMRSLHLSNKTLSQWLEQCRNSLLSTQQNPTLSSREGFTKGFSSDSKQLSTLQSTSNASEPILSLDASHESFMSGWTEGGLEFSVQVHPVPGPMDHTVLSLCSLSSSDSSVTSEALPVDELSLSTPTQTQVPVPKVDAKRKRKSRERPNSAPLRTLARLSSVPHSRRRPLCLTPLKRIFPRSSSAVYLRSNTDQGTFPSSMRFLHSAPAFNTGISDSVASEASTCDFSSSQKLIERIP